jgi:hypothetical protein
MQPQTNQKHTYVYKSQPYNHQNDCFLKSRDAEYHGILFEMGAGKSKVAVDTAAYLYSLGRINSVLLIAPNGVHRKWLEEDFPFSFPDWSNYRGAVWQAGNKESAAACDSLFTPGEYLRVLCMNVEAFSGLSGLVMAKKFLESTDCLMIIDESTRIKNPAAKRTKTLMKLANKAKYRRILTGAYIENNPFDAYAQFQFLSEDIFGQSFFAFKAEYSELLDSGDRLVQNIMAKTRMRMPPQIVAKDKNGQALYRNLDKLKERIAPYCTIVSKADCLDLPPKIYEKRFFKLDPKQRKLYDQLATKSKAEFMDSTLTVLHKMTLVLRLQQITAGYSPVDGGGMVQLFSDPKDNPRLKCLKDTLEDIEGSVIIWCRFVEEIKQVSDMLGDDCVTYYGEVSNEQRSENKAIFMDGSKRYFVGNAQTGGIGLNLTVAATVVYYSNTFSYGNRAQSEDRAHRIGQESDKVTYIDVEAEDTIDEKIVGSLIAKKNMSQFMLEMGDITS